MVRSRPSSSTSTILRGSSISLTSNTPRRRRPTIPASTSKRAPTPRFGPPRWRTPRTAGSQSALEMSPTTAKASLGGTGSVAVALASIMPGPSSIQHGGELALLFEPDPTVYALRRLVVAVDIEADQGDLVEEQGAQRRHPSGGNATAAPRRGGEDALDLYDVGCPGAQLGLEHHLAALDPSPAPGAVHELRHPRSPGAGIVRCVFGAQLLAVRLRSRARERARYSPGAGPWRRFGQDSQPLTV